MSAVKSALKRLFPPGLTFSGHMFDRLIEGISLELERIAQRAKELCENELPDTALELIPEWEALLNLTATQNLTGRKNEIAGHLAAIGGQSISYYYEMIRRISKSNVLIESFEPCRIGIPIGSPIYGESWAFCWQISEIEKEDLTTIKNVISRVKHAHTVVLFKEKESHAANT